MTLWHTACVLNTNTPLIDEHLRYNIKSWQHYMLQLINSSVTLCADFKAQNIMLKCCHLGDAWGLWTKKKRCLLGPKLLTHACSRSPLIRCQWRVLHWVIRTAECSFGACTWVQALLLHDPLNTINGALLWATLEHLDKPYTTKW